MVARKPFADFFQHLSFICPNPKQIEHFKPQLSILCPPLHLVHFSFVSANLGHAEAMCSFERHNWQWLLVLAEKVILGLALPSIPFPNKLMRISF